MAADVLAPERAIGVDDEIAQLVEKRKIEEVLVRYCRSLDRCDAEMMKTTFHEDGSDDHGIFEGGAHAFVDFIIPKIQYWYDVTTHAISNITIELQGDVAYTETYLRCYHRVRGEREKVVEIFGEKYAAQFDWSKVAGIPHETVYNGRYVDKLEKREGEWRIAKRRVVTDWIQNGITTEVYEGVVATFPPVGRRDRSDISYERD